jgi:hypothetical protein
MKEFHMSTTATTHTCPACGHSQRADWFLCDGCGRVIKAKSIEQLEWEHEWQINRVEWELIELERQ